MISRLEYLLCGKPKKRQVQSKKGFISVKRRTKKSEIRWRRQTAICYDVALIYNNPTAQALKQTLQVQQRCEKKEHLEIKADGELSKRRQTQMLSLLCCKY